jgi:hypothetical protein
LRICLDVRRSTLASSFVPSGTAPHPSLAKASDTFSRGAGEGAPRP